MRLIILLCLIGIGAKSFGQNLGYFGKKNMISIHGTASYPLIYNIILKTSLEGNSYFDENTSGDFSLGFGVSYTRILSRQFGLGFEYNMLNSSFYPKSSGDYFYESDIDGSSDNVTFKFKPEQIKVKTTTYMPKIEFSASGNSTIIGLNNQLGFGFTSSKLNTETIFSRTPTLSDVSEWLQSEVQSNYDKSKTINRDIGNVYGLTFMYAINMRVPVSKSFLINYGARFTANYTFRMQNNGKTGDYYLETSSIKSALFEKRLMSILEFNLGFNYCF